MSIDKETLEYDNTHGVINGTVDITINVNDVVLFLSASFNNRNRRKDIRITKAFHKCTNLVSILDDADVWAGDEDEIYEAIEELEAPKEPEFNGYGYNGSDVQ